MRKEIINLLLLMLLLPFSACRKEQTEPESPKETGWTTVHLRARVSGGIQTKSTLDQDDRHYIFERDDLLYVTNKNSGHELYGFLYLIAGAGETDAVFEGDLMYFDSNDEPVEPDPGFAISATLVSSEQRASGFFTTVSGNDGKIATGPNYGNAVTATFKEAVQKYSHFTGDATYGNPSFSLNQQTAFVIFNFAFDDDLLPGSLTFNFNNDGAQVRTITVTPDSYKQAGFVAAFPAQTALDDANVTISGGGLGGGSGLQRNLRNATLLANRYYNVKECYVDLSYFTIHAGTEDTDITFNYSTIEYSTDDGTTWTSASVTPTVTVVADNSIKVRGSGSKYDYNSNGEKSIFTSTKSCYIYGDIMSLFSVPSSLQEAALRGAFKGMDNIDIPPGRPLLLSASTMSGNNCYEQMFYGCTALTNAPQFSQSMITINRKGCNQMFYGCTALKAAPELPAGTINDLGYAEMFSGCTSLEIPPASLGANMAKAQACLRMFQGCSSLRYAPALPAMSVPSNGYQEMFSGCTALLAAPELPATSVASYGYHQMFKDCSSMVTGPSTLPATSTTTSCYNQMFSGCDSLEESPQIQATGTLAESCFFQMFNGCSRLRSAQTDLYFTTIGKNSCKEMFMSCLALNNGPNMPYVTGTVGEGGCRGMFSGCGEMVSTPAELNATAVGKEGYYQMFLNCIKIKIAPSISATQIGQNGCKQMFSGCTRLNTPPPALNATTLADGAYMQMFYGTAIKSSPILPAETLVSNCYREMFRNCKSLTTITCLATSISASNCLNNWVNSIASSGTFVKASGVTWPTGNSGIPSGWTVTDYTP